MHPRPLHDSAFTLVEIMIVVVIIGLLAAMAIPAFQRSRLNSQAARIANDFRQFEAAFQRYNLENGGWPAAAGAGVVPTGMSQYLPAAYTAVSPIGGNYSWSGTSGIVRLTGGYTDDNVMRRVDAILDDGNLATGDFGAIGSGGYHLRLH
jgi:type IV pilus assembly protein PilA